MSVIGGGLLVAVAAALWLAYLMPVWLRRRQYLATERNAVRLQQTLRILAETAETPEPVVLDVTARQVASQQRVLHERERAARLSAQASERLAIAERRNAQADADAAAEVAAEAERASRRDAVEPRPAAAQKTSRPALRRRRARCSLTFLAGLVIAIVGGAMLAFSASVAAVVFASVGGIVMLVAFGGLVVLARRRVPAPVVQAEQDVVAEAFEPVELDEAEAVHEGWVPQPLPRPLTLSRGTIAATAMASIEAAAELQRLAQEAERAKRIEEIATPMPSIAPAASAPAEPEQTGASEPLSPYAGMGVIGSPQRRFDDLDAVLRRRRQAG
ncbi:hypothetical protein BJ978_003245 [Agromyces terreus]|uniref:Large exoprotein n=1 Tax=Agromyces terreus TaxID=424795 RepID=A0A9X2HAS4_9MICO|nr:hypothetical protein [Agromyces terreus]MCP2372569.1 hypothetical protein [Agromyces terreus]